MGSRAWRQAGHCSHKAQRCWAGTQPTAGAQHLTAAQGPREEVLALLSLYLVPTSCYWQSVWSLQNRIYGFHFCWWQFKYQNQKPKAQSWNNKNVSSAVRDSEHAEPTYCICTTVHTQQYIHRQCGLCTAQNQIRSRIKKSWHFLATKVNIQKSGTSINSESALKSSVFVIRPICGKHDVEMYLLFICASWVGVNISFHDILCSIWSCSA